METITINAEGKRMGRLASEIANILNGKTSVEYVPYKVPEVTVTVTHAGKMDIPLRKQKGRVYYRHSGYIGNLKKETLEERLEKKGAAEALRQTVRGMLPKNRLLQKKLNALIIHENE